MKRPGLAFMIVLLAVLVTPLVLGAQQAGKVYRIGWLANDSYPPGDEAFQRGLRDLGWVEGRNVTIESRFVQGKPGRASQLAAELVDLKVDLIVAIAGRALVAKSATSTIPIVFVEVRADAGESREVPVRSREAGDEPQPNGIGIHRSSRSQVGLC